jgi:hypothetical protein
MAEETGVAKVLDEIVPRGPLIPAEQLDMLADEMPGTTAFDRVQAAKGRGRPKGSANRRTRDFAEYLLARYPDPREVMAQTYARPVDELAAELGCTKLEAFQLQQRAAAELAPYLASKMPVAVSVNHRGIALVIPGMNFDQAATVEEAAAMLEISNENQGDSE